MFVWFRFIHISVAIGRNKRLVPTMALCSTIPVINLEGVEKHCESSQFNKSDYGPRTYVCWGLPADHDRLGSTNLHLDMSDACNVIDNVTRPEGTTEECDNKGDKRLHSLGDYTLMDVCHLCLAVAAAIATSNQIRPMQIGLGCPREGNDTNWICSKDP